MHSGAAVNTSPFMHPPDLMQSSMQEKTKFISNQYNFEVTVIYSVLRVCALIRF